MPTYIFNIPFLFESANLHPLLYKGFLITPRHPALPFKRSPLFLESGQGVHSPLPTGALGLSISSSVLLLKPKELNVINEAMTHLAFTSMNTSHSFHADGVMGLTEPSPALEIKFCFYLFYKLRFHVKFCLKRGPVLKDV